LFSIFVWSKGPESHAPASSISIHDNHSHIRSNEIKFSFKAFNFLPHQELQNSIKTKGKASDQGGQYQYQFHIAKNTESQIFFAIKNTNSHTQNFSKKIHKAIKPIHKPSHKTTNSDHRNQKQKTIPKPD
jgi:peptide methionine sulfoxide reductase MsrA